MQLVALAGVIGAAVAAQVTHGGVAAGALTAPVRKISLGRIQRHGGHASGKRQLAHFGDTACPCIGFDNIKGETTVYFDKDGVAYPADLGARCEAWDDGLHPTSCREGQQPGMGNGWCGQAWCFVDPCNCNIDVLPQLSSYLPDATYRGKPLFFSYGTCGGKDSFTAEVPEVGDARCRCIGFDDIPGTTEISFGGGDKVAYPAEIGGTCKAWDKTRHPDCAGKDAPSWCKARWCYVDPCECKLKGGAIPKISAYLPKATFTGKNLYYSYETCGSPDDWTKEGNPDACVNQATKADCVKNVRCAWNGEKCMGTELVSHPLCEGVAALQAAAAPRGVLAALMAALSLGLLRR